MARGLDHLVVAVNDLERAAAAYAALGFTVTPENRHPWGTANRLVQLDGFFIELLSVVDPELIDESSEGIFSFGAFNRDFLKKREGASMLVLESEDPESDRSDFLNAGLEVFAPFSFERTANLADGTTAQVAFDLTFLKDPLAPEIGYFTCRNRYPEHFWKAAFQAHENGGRSVASLSLLAEDPGDHRAFLSGFTGVSETRETHLGLELETPRGMVAVYSPEAYRTVFGSEAADSVRGEVPQIAALQIVCPGLEEKKVIPASALFGLTLVLSPVE